MPELPEVETIVQDLNKKLKGKIIKELTVLDTKALNFSVAKFRKLVVGQVIKSVRRRAKMIIIELKNNFLLIHLKMTGQLVFKFGNSIVAGGHPITGVGKKLPNKFTRVTFVFNDNSQLFFNDVRRFGWIKLASGDELTKIVSDLGVEPLSKEFTLEKFREILAGKPNTTIKQAIMDQKFLAGLGNIYSDESLFLAGIKPRRKAKTLSENEIKKLWQAIPKILKYAVKYRGTSFNDYVDIRGEAGNFIKYLKVYGKAGERCRKCGSIIKKVKLGGRGTHWCDECQR